jgi:heme-degrading monooxygenase HmoA
MTYIFMAVHYPAPGKLDEVYAGMRRMADSATGTPGLVEIGPWTEVSGTRVIGISKWESREAFEAAMPGSGQPNATVFPGEARPRDYFHLESGPPSPGA